MQKKGNKTPEYTKKAIAAYQKKFDRVAVNLPPGTAEKIRSTGESVNGLVNRLVAEYLENIEK